MAFAIALAGQSAFASYVVAANPSAKAAPARKKADASKVSATQKSEAGMKRGNEIIPGGQFEFEPNFNMAFINPKDVNALITDSNDATQKVLKNYSVPKMGTTAAFGFATLARVHRNFAIGLGFNHIANTVTGSGNIENQPSQSITTTLGINANLLTVESKLTLHRALDNKLETYMGPFVGMGFYSASAASSGPLLGKSIETNSSANGIVFGTTAGTRYWFMDNISAGIFTGYRQAKSGNLVVDSVKNSQDVVGKEVDNGGKKISVDASSFMLGAGLTLAI